MHNYKGLKIWHRSMDLVEQVYILTDKIPKNEIYGLIGQIKRSAVSVPSNIAEGAGRSSDKEFIRYLSISTGSLNELNTQLVIARRLDFINEDELQNIEEDINEIQKMTYTFKGQLESNIENLKSQNLE